MCSKTFWLGGGILALSILFDESLPLKMARLFVVNMVRSVDDSDIEAYVIYMMFFLQMSLRNAGEAV